MCNGKEKHSLNTEEGKAVQTKLDRISEIAKNDGKCRFKNLMHLLRLLKRFLKNGYLEDGILHVTGQGTPQGGIVSPVLANIYRQGSRPQALAEESQKCEAADMVVDSMRQAQRTLSVLWSERQLSRGNAVLPTGVATAL